MHNPTIFIITGEQGKGKSRYAASMAEILKEKNCTVKGFIAQGHLEGSLRSGFDLSDIESGRIIPLAKRAGALNPLHTHKLAGSTLATNKSNNPQEKKEALSFTKDAGADEDDHAGNDRFAESIKSGRFVFRNEALQRGGEIIRRAIEADTDVIILDEIGASELRGELWSTSLSLLLANFNGILILTVRRKFLESVKQRWSIMPVEIFDISLVTAEKAAGAVLLAASGRERIKASKSLILNTSPPGIDDRWLKAAVAGGLWAAVEIIIGSFLHNLRIPMAGSLLASFGIILMTAFFQIWPERGLIWRAGLICALMKSISPSAVILGPMTGIMMEALLLEMGIALLGRNLAGFLAGGALALFSALLHKFMSLLLLYGFNIVTIYLNLFYFASRQINIPEADPWLLLSILGGIYLLTGALAAFTGYVAGRKVAGYSHLRGQSPGSGPERLKYLRSGNFRDDIFEPGTGSFSLALFILHITAIPGGLVLMNFSGRLVAYPVLIIYTLFCLVYYKNTIRRFKKPLFWFQLLVIILLATIFLDSFEKDIPSINWSGVLSGVDMNIRAILVVAGFSALSTELKNPLITNFLLKKGFRQLYLAISLAFRALPAMMEEISRPKRFFTNPLSSIREMVASAPFWLETLEKKNDPSGKQHLQS